MADVIKWLFTTPADAMSYIDMTNNAIESLDRDIGRTLVYADPSTYRANAEQWRAEADADAASDNPVLREQAKQERQIAKFWDAQATKLENRAKSRPATQVAREIDYSQSWDGFLQPWRAFHRRVHTEPGFVRFLIGPPNQVGPDGMTAGEAIEQAEAADSTYRRYYAQFKATTDSGGMGQKPTAPLPPTPEEIAKEHKKPLFNFDIPWGTIVLVGGGITAGYLFLTRQQSSSLVVSGGHAT